MILPYLALNDSASTPNSDLLKVRDWAYHWKMTFNPDRTKQIQKNNFLQKEKRNHTYTSLCQQF